MSKAAPGGGIIESRSRGVSPEGIAQLIQSIKGGLRDDGFTGSGIDRFMGAVNSLAEGLQVKGGRLNLQGMTSALQSEGGRSLGYGTIPTIQAYSGDAMSQAEQLLQPFRQMEQAKMFMRATEGAGSIADIAANLRETAGSPIRQLQNLEAADVETRMAYYMGTEEAKGFKVGRLADKAAMLDKGAMGGRAIAAPGASGKFAEREAKDIETVMKEGGLEVLLDMINTLNRIMMKMSSNTDTIAKSLTKLLKYLP